MVVDGKSQRMEPMGGGGLTSVSNPATLSHPPASVIIAHAHLPFLTVNRPPHMQPQVNGTVFVFLAGVILAMQGGGTMSPTLSHRMGGIMGGAAGIAIVLGVLAQCLFLSKRRRWQRQKLELEGEEEEEAAERLRLREAEEEVDSLHNSLLVLH